jgi:serine/threonine protein kinase
MTSALSRYCNQCGALVADQATICSACGTALRASNLAPSMPGTSLSSILSVLTAAGPLRPGSLFAQRYRILSRVGEGGFGMIYKAQDIEHHRRLVAIKQISLNTFSPRDMIEATDSYNREVRHLSQLRHNCIPRIYAYLTDPDHWYVVMDFIEGQTLEDKLKKARRGRLSTSRVLEIGIGLCEVLGYLHAQHPPIVFRDVKPANIMLTKTGRVYLIDFGIARQYTADRTRDTGPLGSPGYAAPEQYGKAQSTAQTDIYGLGATLQTLLTGSEPLELATSSQEQVRKIHRRIPRSLQPLLQHMLERDASKRPQSIDEVNQFLLWFKEHAPEQRVKRTLAFIGDFLIHSGPGVLLMVALLIFISLTFFYTGFFDSPFWIPCLLVMLCVIVGRSAYYLHRKKEETTSRLSAKEALSTVLKRLKGSILFALIPAMLFYYLYDLQIPRSSNPPSPVSIADYLFLGGIVLVFILGGLALFKREIMRLVHRVPLWRRGRKQEHGPLLQQQMHKRP